MFLPVIFFHIFFDEGGDYPRSYGVLSSIPCWVKNHLNKNYVQNRKDCIHL
jgi:hypothetical protein